MTKPSPLLGLQTADQSRRPRGAAAPPAAAAWRAAEDRLYPLVMVDPACYEAALTLVGEVAEVLRGRCGTVAELVGADAAAVLARCPTAPVLSALGLDPDVAFDAACAGHWRELTAAGTDAEHQASQDGSR